MTEARRVKNYSKSPIMVTHIWILHVQQCCKVIELQN